jgi:anti-anti-sigma factor
MTTMAALEQDLERAMDSGGDLVIDVRQLTFIDAAGLRTLARAADRMQRDGRSLRLARPTRQLLRLLRVLDLAHLATSNDEICSTESRESARDGAGEARPGSAAARAPGTAGLDQQHPPPARGT